MKTISKFLLFSTFFFLSTLSFSQVKVYPQNKVHVGPIWSSSFQGQTDECFYINGGVNVSCIPANSGFSFIRYQYNSGTGTYDLPALIPQWPSSMLIGTPTTPLFELYSSNIYSQSGAVYVLSDSSYKINFRPSNVDSNYAKIRLLQTYKYKYNSRKLVSDSTIYDSIPHNGNSNDQIGFKAQEIQLLYPELVKYDSVTGKYYVNYIGLIPLLTEAIKKQSVEIEALKTRIYTIEHH